MAFQSDERQQHVGAGSAQTAPRHAPRHPLHARLSLQQVAKIIVRRQRKGRMAVAIAAFQFEYAVDFRGAVVAHIRHQPVLHLALVQPQRFAGAQKQVDGRRAAKQELRCVQDHPWRRTPGQQQQQVGAAVTLLAWTQAQ